MQTENSHSPFLISIEEEDVWIKRPHQHNFFEFVFIEDGNGMQCINYNELPYHKNSFFLLPPYDCHTFKIVNKTTFVFIKFNASFFQGGDALQPDYSGWFNKLQYILTTYNRRPGDIMKNESDKLLVIGLVQSIVREYTQIDNRSESIIKTNLVALLNIVSRNFEDSFLISQEHHDQQAIDILNYIQHHLFENDKLRNDVIAGVFNVSSSYFGELFKKKTGNSLKEYILRSRINVAESRIKHSGYTIKEIAHELGFTDASHLSKMIKKYRKADVVCG